jgi:hypothetical protein
VPGTPERTRHLDNVPDLSIGVAAPRRTLMNGRWTAAATPGNVRTVTCWSHLIERR